jgi:hypothetical protein
MDTGRKPPKLWPFFLVEILLLIPWLPIAGLSAMAYDSGSIWPGVLAVGPLQAYPLFIGLALIIAPILRSYGKYTAAIIVAVLPPCISYAWLGVVLKLAMISDG